MTLTLAVRTSADVAHYPPGATFGPRVLRDFEFVWLLRGSAEWDCDGRRTVLRPGSLVLARPGMADRFAWDPAQASVHAYVHFRVLDPGALGAPDTWPLARTLSVTDPLAGLCRYLLWLGGSSSPATPGRTTEVLCWLLDLFVRGPLPADEPAGDSSQHLARLVNHLGTTWRDGRTSALSLAELAGAAGISAGHLSRLFRDRYAVGPVAAIELIRLARSATLLQRSNLTVGAVAASCGFANPFHFSRRFRVVYGDSPRAYRTVRSADDPLEPLARAGLLPLAHRLLVEDLLDDG